MPDKDTRSAPDGASTPTIAEQIISAWLAAGAPMREPDGFEYNAAENIGHCVRVLHRRIQDLDGAGGLEMIGPGRWQQRMQENAWAFLFGNGSEPVWPDREGTRS